MHFVAGVRQQRHILTRIWKNFNQSQQNKCQFFGSTSNVLPVLTKLKCSLMSLHHRCYSSETQFANSIQNKMNDLFVFHHEWPDGVRTDLLQDMIVIENFVTEIEEQRLCAEAEKSMKRMRYQYDHWDNAIQGYRARLAHL